jgi:hypothetical protein
MSPTKKTEEFIATGRRKTSTARVRIKPGSGKFVINKREYDEYCSTDQHRKAVIGPLLSVEKMGQLDISVNVSGGGGSGQAGRKQAICDEIPARLSGKKQAVLGHVKDSNFRKDNTKLLTIFYNNPSDSNPRGLFFILLTNFFTINENMYHWSLWVFRAGFG